MSKSPINRDLIAEDGEVTDDIKWGGGNILRKLVKDKGRSRWRGELIEEGGR